MQDSFDLLSAVPLQFDYAPIDGQPVSLPDGRVMITTFGFGGSCSECCMSELESVTGGFGCSLRKNGVVFPCYLFEKVHFREIVNG